MKTFLAFIKKEFKHIFRDKRTLIILFGMPVIQVLLFGFGISTEIKNGKMAILDLDKSSESLMLINKISSSDYFITEQYLENYNQIEDIFKKGEIKIALVIPENFSRDLVSNQSSRLQIINDASDPNMANILNSYFLQILNKFNADRGIIPQQGINIEHKMLYNRDNKSVFMFVPGVMTIILMLVSAMMTSITVAKEKEIGTMEVLLISPLKPVIIVLGKVIPYILLAVINSTSILLLGLYVFGMPLNGSLLLLSAEIFIFIITSLSLGILISIVANSQQTAMMISMMGLMLPTIILSGFIFPIESMPYALQIISNIVPAKYFIVIIKSIMIKGVGLEVIWFETLVLLLMNVILIGISIKKFKSRLE